MTLTTRMAIPLDAQDMTDVLNEIIGTGGTTAHEKPYTPQQMIQDYIKAVDGISCVVAEIDGQLVGFQTTEWPDPDWDGPDPLPEDWAIIATFVKQGMTGAGIGAALFKATRTIADNAGAVTIDATIRADNTGGLRYYSKMGFVDYKLTANVPLTDGTPVNRVSKRFDL